jgi:hypothetical protein
MVLRTFPDSVLHAKGFGSSKHTPNDATPLRQKSCYFLRKKTHIIANKGSAWNGDLVARDRRLQHLFAYISCEKL